LREQELSENAEQAGSPADQGAQTTQVQPAAKTSSSSAIPVPLDGAIEHRLATGDDRRQSRPEPHRTTLSNRVAT